MEAKLARAPGLPEPAKSPSWVVLAVWGPTRADPSGVVAFAGALAATLTGAAGRRGAATGRVAHRWVVGLVVPVVLGGTAMVVGGTVTVVVDAGTVAGVTPRKDWLHCCAVGIAELDVAACVWGAELTSA